MTPEVVEDVEDVEGSHLDLLDHLDILDHLGVQLIIPPAAGGIAGPDRTWSVMSA